MTFLSSVTLVFWPVGSLIAPFYGKLTPYQVYYLSTPVTGDTALYSASNREHGGSPHPPPPITVWNPSNFDIFYQNIRGLRTQYSGITDSVYASYHKICNLTKMALSFCHNHFQAFYSVFRADRGYLISHTTRVGGVLIAVSNLLQSVRRSHDLETTEECVWIPVTDIFNLLIGNHYFPADCNVTTIDNYFNFFGTKFKCTSVLCRLISMYLTMT
jgi:hypothetical protein